MGDGRRDVERVPRLGDVADGDAYLDARGPLRADWRAGDSAWSLVDGVALGRAFGPDPQSRHGKLEWCMTEHDARRPVLAGGGRAARRSIS